MLFDTRRRYKESQERSKEAYRNRGRVVWISCQIIKIDDPTVTLEQRKELKEIPQVMVKRKIKGTMRFKDGRGLRGKAAKKAAKRLTHSKRFYLQQRAATA